MINELEYEYLQGIVTEIGLNCSISEVHGSMIGLLCANFSAGFERWLEQLHEDDRDIFSTGAEHSDSVSDFFYKAQDELCGDSFEFSPFLPDDNTPLQERLYALKDWCQGFLYGIGHTVTEDDWSSEFREIIGDIVEICRLDPNSGIEDEDEDEESIMHLIEYLRVAVELIRVELNTVPQRQH